MRRFTPQELIAAFAKGNTANAGGVAGAPSSRSPQRAPGGVAEVRSLLGVLDNSPEKSLFGYDEWIKVGMAVKGALPDDEGEAFELWREWSEQQPQGVDLWDKWESLDPQSAGWGFLEIMAKPFGWNAATEVFDTDDDMGLLGVGAGGPPPHPTDIDQTLVANWIRDNEGWRLKWNVNRKQWVAFDGTRWVLQHHECGFEQSRRWAGMIVERKAAKSANFHTGVEKMLRNEPSMIAREVDFDADPWLAGVPGGTLDLRTGRVRAGRAADMITKALRVDPAGACPRWLKFVDEVTQGDAELKLFLKQWAGYCLTGVTTEQKLVFLYGPGGNGKSVFIDTLAWALGDYAVKAMRDVFILKKNAGHPAELAAMAGARLVVASEVSAAAQWDEAVIKDVTGGGDMTARFMRQNPFTFPITFKVMCYGNHKPTFPGGVGVAIQRRFWQAEFMFRPKVVDADLMDKLKAEAPGILRWALSGLLDPKTGQATVGLMEPAVVRRATDTMFAEADPLERWLQERTSRDAKAKTSTADLFEDWNKWRIANNEHALEQVNAFSTALKDQKGLKPYRTMKERGFEGLKLKGSTGAAAAFDDEDRP